jgi:hypothetical protein
MTSAPITEKIVIENDFDFSSESSSRFYNQNLSLNDTENVVDYTLNTSKKSSKKSLDGFTSQNDSFKLYGLHHDVLYDWSFLSYYDEDQNGRRRINLVAKSKKKNVQMQIDVTSKNEFNKKDNFQMKLVKNPKNKYGQYRFILESTNSLITFLFSILDNKFSFFKFIGKENSSDLPVLFSKKLSLFFIPLKNVIQVYDDKLQYFLKSIEMSKNIEEVILNNKKNLLMVYDLYFYYEVDLERLTINKQIMATNKTKDKFFCPLNFMALPIGKKWKGVFYYIGKKTIRSISISENLELKSFPFYVLFSCFNKKNHPKAIRHFAKYYFKKLDESKRIDFEYGPINPLIITIFNQNSALLEELLSQYYYPSRIYNYISPLEYAFKTQHKASINELCDSLINREETIYFSRSDFKYLLASKQTICHKVISTIMSDPNIEAMPNLIYMNSNVIAKSTDDLLSMAVLLMREDELKEIEADKQIEQKGKKKIFGDKKYYIDNKNKLSKNEISVSTVPFKYNYSIGTEDSVMFVDRFAASNSDDFILSDWKEIINIKWIQFKIPYIILFLIFYTFLVFITLSLCFLKKNQLCRWVSIWLDAFFMVYEVFRFFTFATYKPYK